MKPANRNVWLELAAFSLFLLSLILFLVAGLYTGIFVVHTLLPNEPPMTIQGVVVGWNEVLVCALSTGVPGVALVAAAWGLQSLLVDEEEQDA